MSYVVVCHLWLGHFGLSVIVETDSCCFCSLWCRVFFPVVQNLAKLLTLGNTAETSSTAGRATSRTLSVWMTSACFVVEMCSFWLAPPRWKQPQAHTSCLGEPSWDMAMTRCSLTETRQNNDVVAELSSAQITTRTRRDKRKRKAVERRFGTANSPKGQLGGNFAPPREDAS